MGPRGRVLVGWDCECGDRFIVLEKAKRVDGSIVPGA